MFHTGYYFLQHETIRSILMFRTQARLPDVQFTSSANHAECPTASVRHMQPTIFYGKTSDIVCDIFSFDLAELPSRSIRTITVDGKRENGVIQKTINNIYYR